MKSISVVSILFSIFLTSFAQAECNFMWITNGYGSETVGGYACNQAGTHYDDPNVCRAQCGNTGDSGYVVPMPVKKCSTEYILRDRGERRLCLQKVSTGDGGYILMASSDAGCHDACYEQHGQ